jgi:transcriptional regulator with XRE-family HTH domain
MWLVHSAGDNRQLVSESSESRRGRRKTNPTWARSNLAKARIASGLDQKTMAEKTGIPLSTYRRLERGKQKPDDLDNPPIRYLINCALVLHMSLEEVSPVALDEWTVFDVEAAEPPVESDHIKPFRWER